MLALSLFFLGYFRIIKGVVLTLKNLTHLMWKACVNRVTCLTVFHFSYVACAYDVGLLVSSSVTFVWCLVICLLLFVSDFQFYARLFSAQP